MAENLVSCLKSERKPMLAEDGIFCFYSDNEIKNEFQTQSGYDGMSKLGVSMTIFRRDYSDIVGVDIGSSGTKVVRLKQIRGVPTVMAVDILPVILLPDAENAPVVPLQLPKALKARYAAVAVSRAGGIVKLLTFPAHTGKSNDDHVHELMGLGTEVPYRLGYEPVFENRTEVRVLASALPDVSARNICELFPAGIPAPCSLEISGLASLTSFRHGRVNEDPDDCSVLVDFGAAVTLVALYNKKNLALVRKFDFGTVNILKKLQDSLGVDQEVALGILNDGSFDVTKVVHQAMEPFVQQLIISLDFVERRENVHVGKLCVCGGGVGMQLWAHEMESATGLTLVKLNPFDGLAIHPGVVLDHFKGQEPRFSAAVGAALAMLKVG